MLYDLFEAQHELLSPWRFGASFAKSFFSDPVSPWSHAPFARHVAAANDLFLRVTGRYHKPEWNLRHRSVLEKPFCRLLRFSPPGRGPRVLVVAPLSGHHATLLRDTVASLVRDHEVWVTDWVDARMVPLEEGAFHLHDYVAYLREFITLLSPGVNVVSVCQPTVPVLAAVSLMAQHGEAAPRSMVMMGGPIDARRSPTAVNNLATERPFSWFEQTLIHAVPSKYPGSGRRVYPGFLQWLGFVAMNPGRHMRAHGDYYRHLVRNDGQSADTHRRFYDEYNAVLDLPAEYYLDTIRAVFQDFDLPQGRMRVQGELVEPAAIRDSALLTIEGELDDISGNGQTAAAHDLCLNIPTERREHFTAPGAGHYGIFSGGRWREIVYPRVREFIRKHA